MVAFAWVRSVLARLRERRASGQSGRTTSRTRRVRLWAIVAVFATLLGFYVDSSVVVGRIDPVPDRAPPPFASLLTEAPLQVLSDLQRMSTNGDARTFRSLVDGMGWSLSWERWHAAGLLRKADRRRDGLRILRDRAHTHGDWMEVGALAAYVHLPTAFDAYRRALLVAKSVEEQHQACAAAGGLREYDRSQQPIAECATSRAILRAWAAKAFARDPELLRIVDGALATRTATALLSRYDSEGERGAAELAVSMRAIARQDINNVLAAAERRLPGVTALYERYDRFLDYESRASSDEGRGPAPAAGHTGLIAAEIAELNSYFRDMVILFRDTCSALQGWRLPRLESCAHEFTTMDSTLSHLEILATAESPVELLTALEQEIERTEQVARRDSARDALRSMRFGMVVAGVQDITWGSDLAGRWHAFIARYELLEMRLGRVEDLESYVKSLDDIAYDRESRGAVNAATAWLRDASRLAAAAPSPELHLEMLGELLDLQNGGRDEEGLAGEVPQFMILREMRSAARDWGSIRKEIEVIEEIADLFADAEDNENGRHFLSEAITLAAREGDLEQEARLRLQLAENLLRTEPDSAAAEAGLSRRLGESLRSERGAQLATHAVVLAAAIDYWGGMTRQACWRFEDAADVLRLTANDLEEVAEVLAGDTAPFFRFEPEIVLSGEPVPPPTIMNRLFGQASCEGVRYRGPVSYSLPDIDGSAIQVAKLASREEQCVLVQARALEASGAPSSAIATAVTRRCELAGEQEPLLKASVEETVLEIRSARARRAMFYAE